MCGSGSQVKPACEIGNTQLRLPADRETYGWHGCRNRLPLSAEFDISGSIELSRDGSMETGS
jgi:hypothetical protein